MYTARFGRFGVRSLPHFSCYFTFWNLLSVFPKRGKIDCNTDSKKERSGLHGPLKMKKKEVMEFDELAQSNMKQREKKEGLTFMFIMTKLANKSKLIDNGNKHTNGVITMHFNIQTITIQYPHASNC
ncbi:hypothetical protein AABB24_033461 [Solanum stoloniferum]|uniref:Uncharacterized protein n=1 Tax=Solanum stoloniferum TaxID=62892 RepID=A0ABD2RQJ1_9SOLN